MGAKPAGSGGRSLVGHDFTGYVLIPERWLEHHGRLLEEERLLEERDDADAARIWDEVKPGREPVFTHDEVWGDDR